MHFKPFTDEVNKVENMGQKSSLTDNGNSNYADLIHRCRLGSVYLKQDVNKKMTQDW